MNIANYCTKKGINGEEFDKMVNEKLELQLFAETMSPNYSDIKRWMRKHVGHPLYSVARNYIKR